MEAQAGELVAAAINAGKPIATHSEGWSATSIGVWTLVATLVPVMVTAIVKLLPVMRKLANERQTAEDSAVLTGFKAVIDAQAAEISRLSERIDKLEREAAQERERHAAERRQLAAGYEAELALQRHATRNAKQVLYGTLDLIEAAPDNAAAHASKMRKRMEELDKLETEEAASIRGAKIIAAGAPEKPGPNQA